MHAGDVQRELAQILLLIDDVKAAKGPVIAGNFRAGFELDQKIRPALGPVGYGAPLDFG